MDRAKKNEITAQLAKMMDSAAAIYLADFEGMTVKQAEELRDEIYKNGLKYRVVKNTLALRAMNDSVRYSAYRESLKKYFKGQTGLILSDEDPVIPAKIIKMFFEKSQKPKLKAAIFENQIFDSDKLDELASLLTKNEVIACILSSLDAPASGIIGSINAVMRDLASVIEEAAKSKAA